MNQIKTILFGLTVILFTASAASAGPITSVVGFGDSIVDSGNTQLAVTGGGGPNPNPAAVGYFAGRFSNGPNYLDLVNQQVTGSLASPSLLGGNNFSFAGARALENGDSLPDLAGQVGLYLAATGGVADPNALYVINAGGNDVRDFLLGALGATTPEELAAAVVDTIISQTLLLTAAGAENIMIANIGDVGGIPELVPFGPVIAAQTTGLVMAINGLLAASLDGLGLDINLLQLPVFEIGQNILDDPTAYGLPAGLITNVGCLLGTGGGAPDVDCSQYAFFDQIHPTAAIHALIANQAILIARIPEPETALLLLLGLTGLLVRRRVAAIR